MDLSKLKLPNNSEYNFKDAYARENLLYPRNCDGHDLLVTEDFDEVNKALYLFRIAGNRGKNTNRLLLNKVVGGTLAVNQFNSNNKGTGTVSDVTFTNNGDGSWTLNGTASASGTKFLFDGEPQKIINHVYFVRGFVSGGAGSFLGQGGISIDKGNGGLWKNTQYTTNFNLRVDFAAGNSWNNAKIYPQVTDITQFCGSTIADYVYNLEQSTAGSGVAWLKQYYPSIFNGYQPYNAGTLESVEASEHRTIGFNQLNLEDFATAYPSYCSMVNDDEMAVTTYSSLYYNGISVNFKPIHMTYEVKCGTATGVRIKCVFEDGYSASFSSSSSTTYVKRDLDFSEAFTNLHGNLVSVRLDWSGTGTFWIKNLCANVSAPEKSGTYERYVENVYPLDSDLVLRGIPKISNGVPYYDGDEYKSDGTVTRKYGVVDLGTLNWTYDSQYVRFYVALNTARQESAWNADIVCAKYVGSNVGGSDTSNDKVIGTYDGYLYVRDKSYTDAPTFKTSVNNVYAVYEFKTYSTETADPYTNPQVCYSNGTEEFVSDNFVPVQCEVQYGVGTGASKTSELENDSGFITGRMAVVELPAADWDNSQLTVDVTGVTASNNVIVMPAPASAADYNTNGVYCSDQGDGTLTFDCTSTPTNDMNVNVIIF